MDITFSIETDHLARYSLGRVTPRPLVGRIECGVEFSLTNPGPAVQRAIVGTDWQGLPDADALRLLAAAIDEDNGVPAPSSSKAKPKTATSPAVPLGQRARVLDI